jgi:O-antigen/teichoic acid export membrane protein
MKLKSFFNKFRDLTSLGIGNIVTVAIGGLFWLYVASFVEVEEYGQIGYVISMAGLVSGMSLLGSSSSITVLTSKKDSIFVSISLLAIICGSIGATILYFLVEDIGSTIYVIGIIIFQLINAELLGKKSFITYSKYLIVQRILMVIFALTLFHFIGYEGIILGIGLSFLVFSIKFYQMIPEFKIDFKNLKIKWVFLVNNYLLEIARLFSGTLDKLIIAPIFGFIILGNYYFGIQIFSVIVLIPTIMYQYILPHDASEVSTKRIKRITVLVSIGLALIGYFSSPIIIPNLFPKYQEAIELIQILSIVTIPTTINLMYISKFLSQLKNKIILVGTIIVIPIQIIGIIILGKEYGVVGLGMAVLIADLVQTIYYVIVDRYTK